MSDNLLRQHAKSFFWASFFLSKKKYLQCSSLYSFCRTLDDIVDENSNLSIKKDNFLKFKNDFTNKNFDNQIIKKMWSLIESENISQKIIYDLFDGVETDLKDKIFLII